MQTVSHVSLRFAVSPTRDHRWRTWTRNRRSRTAGSRRTTAAPNATSRAAAQVYVEISIMQELFNIRRKRKGDTGVKWVDFQTRRGCHKVTISALPSRDGICAAPSRMDCPFSGLAWPPKLYDDVENIIFARVAINATTHSLDCVLF